MATAQAMLVHHLHLYRAEALQSHIDTLYLYPAAGYLNATN